MFSSVKRRVVIHHDKDLLKNAVINNLVPEDRREILFNTQISDDDESMNDCNEYDSVVLIQKLEDRIDKLEVVVKKLVEYLVKGQQNGI